MTREEALCDLKSYKFNTKSKTNNAKAIINKIYDDFESQTCDNCKHYSKEDECKAIPLEFNYHGKPSEYLIVSNEFGCKLWESKDD